MDWRGLLEISILATILYSLWLGLRSTKDARLLLWLLLIYFGLLFLSSKLQLEVIFWLMRHLALVVGVGLIIIFQPEIRRIITSLATHRILSFSRKTDKGEVENLVNVMVKLSKKRLGALIAIEQKVDLESVEETGVRLHADFSDELVLTIFHSKTPLHDGGVIIRDGKLLAAACVFPVSQREINDRSVGLRHRAALGISESTDAVALIVSEETGSLGIAYEGKLERELKPDELKRMLHAILAGKEMDEESMEAN